jgi:hypothetical protein
MIVAMWGSSSSTQTNYVTAKFVAGALVLLFNFTVRRTILFSKRADTAGRTASRTIPQRRARSRA